MPDLFISYSRRDKASFVERFIKALNENGYSSDDIWVDWEDIPASSKWENEIESGIEGVNSVIFVLSPNWVESKECAKELDFATKHSKRLFPVIWQDVDPKTIRPELASLNWIFLRETDRFEKGLQTLLDALKTDLGWVKKHTHYLTRARDWDAKGRDTSALLTGAELQEAENWLAQASDDKQPRPNDLQKEFILKSRQEETDRQRRNLRNVLIALGVSIILAISALLSSIEARRQGQIALASQLAAQSTNLVYTQPDISLLLSLEANHIGDQLGESDPAWSGSLLTSLNASPHLGTYLRAHTDAVRALAFSNDGKWLASTGQDSSVLLWDASGSSVKLYKKLEGPSQRLLSVRFSKDNRYIFAAGKEKTIFVWDLEKNGSLINRWAIDDQADDDIRSLSVLTLDGRELLAASLGHQVFFWDIETGKADPSLTLQLAAPNGGLSIQSMAVTQDNSLLAVGTDDGSITVWDLNARKILYRRCSVGDAQTADREACKDAEQSSVDVRGVAFSPDGKWLASGSADPYIHLWDASSGDLLELSPESAEGGHTNSVSSVTFTGKNELVSASWDNTVRIWKLESGSGQFALDDVLYGHANSIWAVVSNPKGTLLASGSSDETVIIWKLNQLNQIGRRVAQMNKNVWALAASPDGKQLAAGDEAGNIQLWSFDGQSLKEFKPMTQSGEVLTLAYSHDGKWLASAGTDHAIYVWSAEGDLAWKIEKAHTGDIWSVMFSPDDKYLASASYDKTVRIWDVQQHKQITPDLTHNDEVYALTFNKTGTQLLVAGYGRDIHVWDVSVMGKPVALDPLSGHQAAVNSLSFNPRDPFILASTSDDKTLLIWNLEKRESTPQVMGLGESMEAVVFHPNGDELASATNNKTVLLWKWDRSCATDWHRISCQPSRLGSPLVGHRAQVQNVVFLSETKLVSSSEDGQIILWDLDRNHWYERACSIVNEKWDSAQQRLYTNNKVNTLLLGVRSWWSKTILGETPPASPSCLVDD